MCSFTGTTRRSKRAMGRMCRRTEGSRRCIEGSTEDGGLWSTCIIPECQLRLRRGPEPIVSKDFFGELRQRVPTVNGAAFAVHFDLLSLV
jgi:hypothetical protein